MEYHGIPWNTWRPWNSRILCTVAMCHGLLLQEFMGITLYTCTAGSVVESGTWLFWPLPTRVYVYVHVCVRESVAICAALQFASSVWFFLLFAAMYVAIDVLAAFHLPSLLCAFGLHEPRSSLTKTIQTEYFNISYLFAVLGWTSSFLGFCFLKRLIASNSLDYRFCCVLRKGRMADHEIDMDAMLAGLQAELQAVQLQESAHKLSERNCVELVTKLQSLGKLDLLSTFSSVPEYVTLERLEDEIVQELAHSGGRVSLPYLQSAVNLDIVHVENAVQRLIQKRQIQSPNKASAQLELLNKTELLSRAYVQSVASEVNDIIYQEGHMTLADISRRFDLPVRFVTANIKPAITAHFSDDRFYTEEFVRKIHARVRGVLIGITKVSKLSAIWKRFQLDAKIAERYTKKLLASGILKGSYTNGSFSPAVVLTAQQKQIEREFEQQGFFDVATAKERGVSNLLTFLRHAYPQCQPVGSEYIVDQRVVHQVQSHLLDLHAHSSKPLTRHWADGKTYFDVDKHVMDFHGGVDMGEFDTLFDSPVHVRDLLQLAFRGLATGESVTGKAVVNLEATGAWRPPPAREDGTIYFDDTAHALGGQKMLYLVENTCVMSRVLLDEAFRVAADNATALADEHCRYLVVESSAPNTPRPDGTPDGNGAGEDEYVIIHTAAPPGGKKVKRGKKEKTAGRGNESDGDIDGNTGRGRQKRGKGRARAKARRGKKQDDDAGDEPSRGRRGGPKKSKSRRGRNRGELSSEENGAVDEPADDDDTNSRRGKEKGKRKNGKAKGKNGKAKGKDKKSSSSTPTASPFLSRFKFRQMLEESAIGGSLEGPLKNVCVNALEKVLYAPSVALYNQRCAHLQTSIFKAASSNSRQLRLDVDKLFDEAWTEFAASAAGIDSVLKIRKVTGEANAGGGKRGSGGRKGEARFPVNGECHRELRRMLARSQTCTRALGLLLANMSLQLDSGSQLPASVVTADDAARLGRRELRQIVRRLEPHCRLFTAAVTSILNEADGKLGNAGNSSNGGGSGSSPTVLTSQGIEQLAALAGEHADMYAFVSVVLGSVGVRLLLPVAVWSQHVCSVLLRTDMSNSPKPREGLSKGLCFDVGQL